MAKGHRLADLAGRHLQAQPLPGRPLVEILGTNRVLIENHDGISGYSLSEVIVGVGFGQIKILGDRLSLSMMNREQLVVSGVIDSVELIRRGNPCK